MLVLNILLKRKESSLTVVGVGPGDPSLLTLAAVQAIKESTLVAYPVPKKNGNSLAADIVKKLIKKKEKLPLEFPMVKDEALLKAAWKEASSKLLNAFRNNHKVVLLSLGDVSLYSTSAYMTYYIKSQFPKIKFKVIPGINSFSAAAAIGAYPLALQKEQLIISPAPDKKEDLEKILDDANKYNRVIVLLKLGSRWIWIREVLYKRKMLDKTLFAQRVGLPDQDVLIAEKVPATVKPYFSLLIIRNSFPDIMPDAN